MGGHLENFFHNIPEYAKHFRVVATDFLWHGRSLTEGFDEQVLPPLVDQVLELLDTLKLYRVHVEGQSLGGWVASLLTLKYPQRVDKLVLTTATGYLPDEGAIPGYKRPNPRRDDRSSSHRFRRSHRCQYPQACGTGRV
jgi:2-hydroxy-6-oxonona-2,4-dienedioate hydrolase